MRKRTETKSVCEYSFTSFQCNVMYGMVNVNKVGRKEGRKVGKIEGKKKSQLNYKKGSIFISIG